jgi:hypothetical protein
MNQANKVMLFLYTTAKPPLRPVGYTDISQDPVVGEACMLWLQVAVCFVTHLVVFRGYSVVTFGCSSVIQVNSAFGTVTSKPSCNFHLRNGPAICYFLFLILLLLGITRRLDKTIFQFTLLNCFYIFNLNSRYDITTSYHLDIKLDN